MRIEWLYLKILEWCRSHSKNLKCVSCLKIGMYALCQLQKKKKAKIICRIFQDGKKSHPVDARHKVAELIYVRNALFRNE